MNSPHPDLYDPANAAALCQFSAAAYDTRWQPGCTVIRGGAETRAVAWEHSDDIIIAFRGTADLRNWLTDLDCMFVEWGAGVLIHAGFAVALKSVRDKINEIVFAPGYKSKRIWVTGHSLGGALAKLFAFETAFDMGRKTISGIYTFGQPRVGNAAFRDFYNDCLGDRTFRVVHADDIVPRIPWLLGSYRHCGHEVFYPAPVGRDSVEPRIDLPWPAKFLADVPGLCRELWYDRLEFLTDHHISNYLQLYTA